ncbi:plasmid mobilization protein [Bombella intestini]|nr:hypothetical protein [Bombella intestini]
MLRVRCSDDEWNDLKKQADDAGLSMSALVRDHLGKLTIRNRTDERKRLAMLNRINANLNMIARWVNTHKSRAETVQIVSHLIAIQRNIKDLSP